MSSNTDGAPVAQSQEIVVPVPVIPVPGGRYDHRLPEGRIENALAWVSLSGPLAVAEDALAALDALVTERDIYRIRLNEYEDDEREAESNG